MNTLYKLTLPDGVEAPEGEIRVWRMLDTQEPPPATEHILMDNGGAYAPCLVAATLTPVPAKPAPAAAIGEGPATATALITGDLDTRCPSYREAAGLPPFKQPVPDLRDALENLIEAAQEVVCENCGRRLAWVSKCEECKPAHEAIGKALAALQGGPAHE